MQYEVEQKHHVEDLLRLQSRLNEFGVAWSDTILQSDQYFAHPAHDFAATDEALRIRTSGDEGFITYKGPKLDATTKTRHELELSIGTGHERREQFVALLNALGFEPVATVRKERRTFEVDYRGHKVDGALDDVEQVGTFLELELQADEQSLEEKQQVIQKLAGELRLGSSERRSYLEMLLEARDAPDRK
jgi:adenylate cyclase class 2